MKNGMQPIKRALSLLMVIAMVITMLPTVAYAANDDAKNATEPAQSGQGILEGKTLSILGDSISTYQNYSQGSAADTTNSTIKGGAIYYPHSGFSVTPESTWWMQTADALGLELLVNNSWSGSCLLKERSGTVGAYENRCVQLHDNTGDNAGQKPDIIAIFLGTNDYYTYPDTLGSYEAIDFSSLIGESEGAYAYAAPTTSLEAYAIILHKISVAYPGAEVYCFTLFPRVNSASQPTALNEDICQLADHFGVYTVDLYNCGVESDSGAFYMLMGDTLHPDVYGMDAMTNAFVSAILHNSKYMAEDAEIYDVTYDLSEAVSLQGTAKSVVGGESFATELQTLTASTALSVNVTMGGVDITASCYANGKIAIEEVTGDVKIQASAMRYPEIDRELTNFRWELKNDALVNVSDSQNSANALTMTHGTISSGAMSGARFSLAEPVCLNHDQPWSLEWKSSGNWGSDGGLLFSEENTSNKSGNRYLYRRHSNTMFALGCYENGTYHNYAVEFAGTGIDTTTTHVFRLTNRIGAEGSNMIWLYVDDQEVGPLQRYWKGGTGQNTTSDWLSGKDFRFSYMGTQQHPLTGCTIEYIQVSENGSYHYHTYEAVVTKPTATAGGYTTYTCTGCGESYVSDYTDPITANNYRWELQGDTLVSVTGSGNMENALTLTNGSIKNGTFSGAQFTLSKQIRLRHDLPWCLEWKSQGTWSSSMQGGLLFAQNASSRTEGYYFYRRSDTTPKAFFGFGEYKGGSWYNYGLTLSEQGIDDTALHTYRLVNRIGADGSNMVYLYVDGREIGALNGYNLNGSNKGTTSNWVSGKDFVFGYLGTAEHNLNNCSIEYIQVWENGEPASTAEDYKGKVIFILGDSISTFAGYIPVADGFNLEHLARYPQDNLLTDVNETWWMQVIAQLDAKLGINDSWRGATCSGAHPVTTGTTGENAAMANLTRIQNLGSNGTPDVILFYGGTNDLAHVAKVGTFDPENAPTTADLVTKRWDNLADGYVHTLLRLKHYYPDAVIVTLLPTYTASYYSDEKLAQGNAVLAQICEHYGVAYVDLRDSGVTEDLLPDGIHPGAEGMDLITQAVLDTLFDKCSMEPGENVVHTVSHQLTGVAASRGYLKGISANESFTETLTGENMTVTVTMGGEDITDACYADGTITIEKVTGALSITAQGDKKAVYADYLQQLPEVLCGKTNLWEQLEHDEAYYTASGWGVHSTGKVRSVTIPVQPGQKIWATSFQAKGTNGGTLDGIRVTWFGTTDVLKSVAHTDVYDEFAAKGCLTVPEGAVAVNIPVWDSSADNEVYILSLDHSYQNSVCTACKAISDEAFLHISFDDVTYCLQNLAKKKYTSLYDEPFFAWLKEMHDTYGAKFSLYTYNNVLKNVPASYAGEFAAASSWLKIGLHAESSNATYASSTYAQGYQAWNTFVAYVTNVTGTADSVDRMPRLHYFAGTREALEGMQDAQTGALGFLAADDNRNSYYFDGTTSANLYGSDHITDLNNGLVYLTTDMRGDWFLSSFSSANVYRKPVCETVYEEMEHRIFSGDLGEGLESYIFFCHEWQIYNGTTLNSGTAWTEDACRFAVAYGLAFDYPQNRTFGKTDFDIPVNEDGDDPEEEPEETPETSTTTTRNGENVTIVADLSEMRYEKGSFAGGINETPVTTITGRAVSRYYVLKVHGGETLTLNQNIEGVELYYAFKEFKDIPLTASNVSTSGEQYLKWLTDPVTLQPDTRYILIGFKNGDASVDFTPEQLQALPGCLTISGAKLPAAQIGDRQYETLAEALNAAQTGETVVLLADVAEELTIGKAITLDVNDKSVTAIILADAGAAVKADEGLTVTTTVADHEIVYENGVYVVKEIKLFNLYGANMDLGNKLDMNFYFLKSHITDTGSYAVITKKNADGSEVSKTIYASDFVSQSKDLYKITFAGIAAKEMADDITVTIYDSNGKQISNIWEDSVRAYSMRMLEDATTDVERTVFVDMLNYGTEAQKYFKYNEDDYANSQLSETEQGYATVLDGLENNSSFDKSYYYGANMDLESSIKFNMYFVRPKVTTDMTVEISYTDHSGNAHEIVVKGSQFFEQSKDLWKVVVDGLVVADVKQIITVVVKDASGIEVTTIVESIESYLARQASASELYKAIMKFGLSANAYLHRNDK